jgi:SHS2 domain-containing protein
MWSRIGKRSGSIGPRPSPSEPTRRPTCSSPGCRCETGHVLFTSFEVTISVDGLDLEATIGGEPIDRDRHILDHEVKAVTHHGARLEREGDRWVAEVILDI